MTLMDFLGKIAGINRLLLTISSTVIGFFFKDRIYLEVIETLFSIKEKGSKIKDFNASDLIKRNISCCFSSKRT